MVHYKSWLDVLFTYFILSGMEVIKLWISTNAKQIGVVSLKSSSCSEGSLEKKLYAKYYNHTQVIFLPI